jgi:hypothetical protein
MARMQWTVVVLMAAACASPAGDDVATQGAAIASQNGLGARCSTHATCASGLRCSAAGQCGCPAGHVACGHGCFDLATDPQNCGQCGHACAPGMICAQGLCGGPPPRAVHDPSFVPPFEIDGLGATSLCVTAREGYPERPANYGTATFDMPFASATLPNSYNWASSYNTWNSRLTYPIPSGYSGQGDAWATTSGYTGLEYVSQIENGSSTSCIGIAATSATNLASGIWTYQLRCATAEHPGPGSADGPSIHYDLGATALYATETDFSTTPATIRLHIYGNCGAGQPSQFGGPCPESTLPIAVATVNGNSSTNAAPHATVTVNPCTHDAIVAYRDDSNQINLRFYNVNGNAVSSLVVNPSAPLAQTTACATDGCSDNTFRVPRCVRGGGMCTSNDCGEQPGCARLASKVHVATKYDSTYGACYAYVAYDASETTGDGQTHLRAHLSIVDMTSEPGAYVITNFSSTSFDGVADNDFGSIVTANEFNRNVGWFYYHQINGNACNTTFTGATSTNLGFPGGMTALGPISGPFPTMHFFGIHGIGDYIGIIKRGLPGGYLFPTWAEPVATSATCVQCGSSMQQYSLAIKGTQLTP